jgi:hypothetical protein
MEAACRLKWMAEVSLFVRDPATGRLVFNSKAIEALGLSPTELAQREYPLDWGRQPGNYARGATTESFC